jgi:hypothetical protein
MRASCPRPDGRALPRRLFVHAAIIAASLIAGGLCGIGARGWIGGLRGQQVQLERCIQTSRQSHSGDDARSMLTRLDADVPACMNAAGYEEALNEPRCSPAFWQGDVFCYVPRSSVGKLIYRLDAARETSPRKG